MLRVRTRLALTFLLVGSAFAAQAATVDPSLFQDLQWRSVGPFRGGRVLAVTGAPDDPKRFYFGAVNGGVWRTDDVGRTWAPIFDQVNVGSIGAITVAPSSPKTIYVGTGEADMRSDIAQGIGMFRSTDGGANWHAIGLSDTQQIAQILVDPRNSNVVLVAALGHPYGPNEQRGVFRSTNGGKTWTKTLYKDADTGAIDLTFEPGNPNVVYAALWQTRRPPCKDTRRPRPRWLRCNRGLHRSNTSICIPRKLQSLNHPSRHMRSAAASANLPSCRSKPARRVLPAACFSTKNAGRKTTAARRMAARRSTS